MASERSEYPDPEVLVVMSAVSSMVARSIKDRAEADILLARTGCWFELIRLYDINPLDYPDRSDYDELLRPKIFKKVLKGKLVAYRLQLADAETIYTWDMVWGPAGVPEGRHNRMTSLQAEHGLWLTGPPDPDIFIDSLRNVARDQAIEHAGTVRDDA